LAVGTGAQQLFALGLALRYQAVQIHSPITPP
jgi:hypothetical protein